MLLVSIVSVRDTVLGADVVSASNSKIYRRWNCKKGSF